MNRPADTRVLAGVDVIAVVAVGVATRAVLGRLDAGIALKAVVPVLVGVALATALLDRRGLRWRDLGCRLPASAGGMAAWTIGLGLVDLLLIPSLTSALANALGWPAQQFQAFAGLRGNLPLHLTLLLPISWGSAAFGEELIFRGFLLRRLGDAFGGTARAELAGIGLQAALFALGHAYLGPRGMLNAGALGLAAGLAYRWNGRNLWPLFIAHGLVDSVGITALYFGVESG